MVLTLEDIARMTERGIYELQTWISGLKALPPSAPLDPCFVALGFDKMPEDISEVNAAYRRLAKAMHPDGGGTEQAFTTLTNNYDACVKIMGSA